MLAVTRTRLTSYYTKIATAANATFSGITVVTGSTSVGPKDLLCYIVSSVSSSAISSWAAVTGGDNVTGNTLCDADGKISASEVYLDIATKNADNLGNMLANIIFHEFMHNKECADPDTVHDSGGGGLAAAGGIKDYMDINPDNVTFMKTRIARDIKQWTDGF